MNKLSSQVTHIELSFQDLQTSYNSKHKRDSEGRNVFGETLEDLRDILRERTKELLNMLDNEPIETLLGECSREEG